MRKIFLYTVQNRTSPGTNNFMYILICVNMIIAYYFIQAIHNETINMSENNNIDNSNKIGEYIFTENLMLFINIYFLYILV